MIVRVRASFSDHILQRRIGSLRARSLRLNRAILMWSSSRFCSLFHRLIVDDMKSRNRCRYDLVQILAATNAVSEISLPPPGGRTTIAAVRNGVDAFWW